MQTPPVQIGRDLALDILGLLADLCMVHAGRMGVASRMMAAAKDLPLPEQPASYETAERLFSSSKAGGDRAKRAAAALSTHIHGGGL